MNENLRERVISSFNLTPDQRDAALERQRDVVVTAGAGSGKTRTLVARYVSLLADGFSPRQVVAVTFTEKAAREMRSRVREAINQLILQAVSEEERQRWADLNAAMDSARIGTIHSLCAEILRAHPAESRIDPKYEIIDEGLAAALKAQIVADTMTTMVGRSDLAPLFNFYEIKQLKSLLSFLLDRRLETQEIFQKNIEPSRVIHDAITAMMQHPSISGCIGELCSMGTDELFRNAGDKLANQVIGLLACWSDAEKALADGNAIACAGFLFTARWEKMKRNVGKAGLVKDIINELQNACDQILTPIIGEKSANDQLPREESETRYLQAFPLVQSAFELLSISYQEALRQRQALDFDDLEYGAAKLLEIQEIRIRWQGEIAALLVDEFQDTNERQRQIVDALTGSPGRLFIVGDARQSIYRFRQADVTVFRSIQQRIKAQDGLVIDLDLTFRTHEPLLQATGDLLQTVMGMEEDPSRPYYVPFSALRADRESQPEYISEPHIEFVFGAGEDAASARPLAAQALACRLLELKDQKQIRTWDDVALLMRASTGFAPYEDAFEEASIPYVTVAGQGFYDRPEIRDVINILQALADPTDDLAMAGLLRSPGFGLTDAALYQLRWQNDAPVAFWTALQGDLSVLEHEDQPQAYRALAILNELLPQVNRIPVSELLKKLVDITDYRAILAVDNDNGAGARLWRNLDKLLADAQSSEQVNVRDFLEYLTTINDAGAREGEAPAEAQGAVRIMTIHKSKGLEFPIVVLADASREPRGGDDLAYLMPDLGLTIKTEPASMLYRLAKFQDSSQEEAEAKRLLYVALTRAKDKLIISGHTTPTAKGEWTAKGWLGELCEAAEIDLDKVMENAGKEIEFRTSSGEPVRAWAIDTKMTKPTPKETSAVIQLQEPNLEPIYLPLIEPSPQSFDEGESTDVHDWRATGSSDTIPHQVIGKMVHKAIELWLFPDNPQLIPLLDSTALNAGLALPSQRSSAVNRAADLLSRLQTHPIRKEIEAASEIFHELPYSRLIGDRTETGYIDLMYQSPNGWQIVDFKTDSIHSAKERSDLIEQYSYQLRRYANAVEVLLGQKARTRICFLDDFGRAELVTI